MAKLHGIAFTRIRESLVGVCAQGGLRNQKGQPLRSPLLGDCM
jgi:hypothetical protein